MQPSRTCARRPAGFAPRSSAPRLAVAVALALVATLLLGACARPKPQAPPAAPEPPASLLGAAGSEPLAFRRVVYRIPVNQVIGEARVGRRAREEVRWTIRATYSRSLNVAITDGLRALGYDVRDEVDALFDPGAGGKVRYEMAAILHGMEVDYDFKYDANRGGKGEGVGKAKAEVEVRLHDAIEERTIYSSRFSGEGIDRGYKPNPMVEAIVNAVLKSARDPQFVAWLARDGSARDRAVASAPRLRITGCSKEAAQVLPENLPTTLEAVVEIQAGNVNGSGVIVSPDGWVVTAAHVVLDAPEFWVRLRNGVQLPATLEMSDAAADLALLRVPGRNHPCAPVRGNADELGLGSDVFAVNRAIGEDRLPTIARGVVSGFPVQDGRRFIQTDASVNPGSSGGPLLAPDGSIAGITVSKIVGIGLEGLGLAVPASEAIERLSIELSDGDPTVR